MRRNSSRNLVTVSMLVAICSRKVAMKGCVARTFLSERPPDLVFGPAPARRTPRQLRNPAERDRWTASLLLIIGEWGIGTRAGGSVVGRRSSVVGKDTLSS